ncbi:MAG: hypothetical protein U1F57_03055 [bacterium]
MKDQNVEVLLNTPLLSTATREEIRSRPILDNILKLNGKIVQEYEAGVLMTVKSIGSEKGTDKNPPFSQVFVPFHKVDHIIFV